MFVYNDISSDDMDLIVEQLPQISTPESRISKTDIPGGTQVIQAKGYDLMDKECTCHYIGQNFDSLLTWLSGSGKVIFDNLNDRYYKAYIGNSIPLEQIVRNKMNKFKVIFTCKPFGYLLGGDIPIILENQTTICDTKCTRESYPTITIKGTGAATVTINNRTFNITDIDGEITIISDPEIQQVLNNKGKYMEGEFPYLDVGENKVTWSGNITRLEITPYWRTWI